MQFPNKEEAVRFFTDVKTAVESVPEMFTYNELVLRFSESMLESISGEWKPLERVPEPFYEINVDGDIRHKVTREIIKPTFEVEWGIKVVKLRMAGETHYFDGPRVANIMFKKKED